MHVAPLCANMRQSRDRVALSVDQRELESKQLRRGGGAGTHGRRLQRWTQSSHRYNAQTTGQSPHRHHKRGRERETTWQHTQNIQPVEGTQLPILSTTSSIHVMRLRVKKTAARRTRGAGFGGFGDLVVRWRVGECCCGGMSQVSGVSGLRGPSDGHPIHLLSRLDKGWGSTGPQLHQ